MLACLVLAVLWSWAGWRRGAYFPSVWYPIAWGTYGVLLLLLSRSSWRLRMTGPARLAVIALGALGVWASTSMLWSPVPAAAFEEGERVFLYLASFGVGLAIVNVLGRRMLLVLGPLVAAAGVAGVMTLVTISSGHDLAGYLYNGTLRLPIGYHSANAAFFLVAFWPAIVLVGRQGLDWRLRALCMGAATMFVELVVLSQSRGSVLAVLVAIPVYVVLSADRIRAGVFLALALLPVLPAFSTLLAVFTDANLGAEPGLAALDSAVSAVVLTSMLSVALGAVAAYMDPRVRLAPERRRQLSRGLVVAGAVAVLAGSVGFVSAEGNPVSWARDRYHEFTGGGNPGNGVKSRFLAGFESNRNDFWRVAIHSAERHPVLGTGSGGYQFAYLKDRHSSEQTHDPHSIELRFLSELGLPGLVLFCAFLSAAALAALRSRRLGSTSAALSVAALAAATYWLAQTSVDWEFDFPAITAPVFALLGAAAAPALLSIRSARPRLPRIAIAIAALALVGLSFPDYLSSRYLDAAYREARADVPAAYADLGRAADVNRLTDEPYLVEGFIALRHKNEPRALRAFANALHREPEDWVAFYGIGAALSNDHPAQAVAALQRSHQLNPRQRLVKRALLRARRTARRQP